MPLLRNLGQSSVFCILLLAGCIINVQTIQSQVYVDVNSTCVSGCGGSWNDAWPDLKPALDNTNSGEIWIAQGIYHPTTDVSRDSSFQIKDGMQLYGGFEGTETDISQRSIEDFPTTLSGDIGVPGDSTDNSFQVVVMTNVSSSTILDGLIIEEGNADGSSVNGTPFSGGGIYLNARNNSIANPIIKNCTIRNNFGGGGGGVMIDCVLGGSSSALFHHCSITGNKASLGNVSSTGAGVLMLGNSGATVAPRFIGCDFIGNYSGNDGGGISATPSGSGSLLAFEVDSCHFENNVTDDRGAGIWMRMVSDGNSQSIIKNSTFIGNQAGGNGGAIYERVSFGTLGQTQIFNCVFKNNSASLQQNFPTTEDGGGAISIRGSQGATNNAVVANCLFVNNSSQSSGGGMVITAVFNGANAGTCTPTIVNNTFYQNSSSSANGIDIFGADPIIANTILWDGGNEIVITGGMPTVSHSIIQGGYSASPAINVHDGYPGFNDPDNDDFSLVPCAAAVDYGSTALLPIDVPDADNDNNSGEILDIDLANASRVFNGTVDCGAFERNEANSFGGIVFVDQNASGLNNGSSWDDAFTDLQIALRSPCSGTEFWVAAGVYYPTSNITSDSSFRIIDGMVLYGGFSGGETSISQREIENNETILSGDVGVPGDSTDNSFRVVVMNNVSSSTIMDGFIIEEGNADGSSVNGTPFSAGGIYLNARNNGIANAIIRNCTIRNNFAGGGGGVMIDCVLGGVSSALFEHCSFIGNTASLGNVSSTGAGILMLGNSGATVAPKFKACNFIGNYSGNDGGGISATPSGNGSILAFEVDSCHFEGNKTDDRGAGIWMRMVSDGMSQSVVKNSVFIGNQAGGNGGALYERVSFGTIGQTQILNCQFINNSSSGIQSFPTDEDGAGAVSIRGSQGATNNAVVANCLFVGNSTQASGGALLTTAVFNGGNPGDCSPSIINNTFYQNSSTFGDGVANFGSTPFFGNNIFWNGGSEIEGINDNPTLQNNIIEGGYIGSGTEIGTIDEDPLFVDPGDDDFSLSPCSPAIDAGDNSLLPIDIGDVDNDNNSGEILDIDLEGKDRIFNSVVDLGALEADASSDALSISLSKTDVTCNGLCDGTITLDITGGDGNYTIDWSNGESTSNLSDLCEGNYIVTVADGSLCTRIDSIEIDENAVILLTVSNDTSICSQESLIVSAFASGGDNAFTYNWDNGLGEGPSHSISPAESTTFTVSVTDGTGCTVTSMVEVTVFDNPEPSISGDNSFCAGETTTLSSNAYSSYNWSTGETTQSINVISSSSILLTVTDNNGCTGTAETIVTQNELPVPSITGGTAICSGESLELSAGSFDQYLWSTGETTASITVSNANTYTVTVTDSNSCSSSTSTVVTENISPSPVLTGDLEICTGETTQLGTVDSYEEYNWSTNENTSLILISNGGNYALTVTDVNGCTGTTEAEVIQSDNPEPLITGDNSFCAGETTTLSSDAFSSYSWSTGETTQSIDVNSSSTILLTVTDNNGCTGTAETTVIQNDLPVPSIAGGTAICSGESLELNAGSFDQYLWSTGETTASITISNANTYTVTVTDGNSCSSSTSVLITENTSPTPVLTGDMELCTGETTQLGTVDSYEEYNWSTNENTSLIFISNGGSYALTVTDVNGCTGTTEVDIIQNDNPEPDISGDMDICEGETTLLNAGEFQSYSWSTNETTQEISVSAGAYLVTVTDANGCTGETNAIVISNPLPTPEILGDNSICSGEMVELDAGDFNSYLWSTNEINATIEVSSGGTYTVTVTDQNECTGSTSIDIMEFNNPNPQITGDLEFCSGESTVLGTDGIYEEYFWTNDNTDATIEVFAGGIWSVFVTDENGCTAMASTEVIENALPDVQISGDLNICDEETTVLEVQEFANYNWSTGQTEQSIIVSGGVYTVSVTDENGCSNDTEVEVVEAEPVFVEIEGQLSICSGTTSTLEAGDFDSYSWSTNETTPDIEVTGGFYSVTVTDNNGCTGVDEVEVIEESSLFPEIAGQPNICGTEPAILDAGVFNSYLWSDNSTDQVLETLLSGIYTVTVSDVNGCTGEDQIEVFLQESPTPIISGDSIICDGEETTLAVSDFDSYSWSTGDTEMEISVSSGQLYSVIVTDENGCTGTDEIEVLQGAPLDLNIEGILQFCTGDSTLLSVDQYDSYLWSTGDTSQTIFVTTAGLYSVSVSDQIGCTDEQVVEVIENESLQPEITGDLVLCIGGTAVLNAGTFESYLWSTDENTATIIIDQPGSYSVTVSDQSGCTGSTTIEVDALEPLSVNIDGDSILCDNEITELFAGDFTNYLWSNEQTSNTIFVNSPGEYAVTVTDVNGCTAMDVIQVEQSESPVPAIVGDTILCFEESGTLQTQEFENYMWSTGDESESITITEGGIYSVEVTDENGCAGTDFVIVVEQVELIPEIIGQLSICEGSSTEISVDEGFESYMWSTDETSSSIIVSAAGIYTVQVVDDLGCVGQNSVEVIVSENLNPEISGDLEVCSGGEAILDAGIFDHYNWSTGDTTQITTISLPGIYSVTVSDSDGCTGSVSVEVGEGVEILFEIVGNLSICEGSATILNAGEFSSYEWSTGEFEQQIVVSEGGDYTVIVTDQNGCTGEASVTVEISESLMPEIEGLLSICNGSSTVLDAGVFSFYNWSNGESTQQIIVSTTGNYIVTVTDDNGCAGIDSVVVNVSEELTPEIIGQISICEGSATILETGIYDQYLWSTGDTTQNILVSEAGVYSILVTDSNGCTGENSINILVNDSLDVQIEGQLSICEGSTSLLDAGIFDSYSWSTGDTTQSIEVSQSGIYTVLVTDSEGCAGQTSIEVQVSESLMPEISGHLTLCFGSSTQLDAGVFDSYSWSTGDTTQSISVDVAGIYIVSVTDESGCTGETSVEVEISENLTPEISGQLSICSGSESELDAGVFESYNWSTGETSQSILVSEAGVYTVIVSDVNGCSGEASVEVQVSENLMPEITGSSSICSGSSTSLDAGEFDEYTWSTGESSQTIQVTSAGIYSVIVSDINGCTGETSIEITESENLEPEITGPEILCQGESIILDAGQFDEYLWNTGETSSSILLTAGGTYSVLVSDGNGCTGESSLTVLEVLPPNLTAIQDLDSICAGENVLVIANANETIQWPVGEAVEIIDGNSILLSPNKSSVFEIVSMNVCFEESIEIEVIVEDLPEIELGGDLFIEIGEMVELNTGEQDFIHWSPSESLSCDNCSNPIANPLETTTYVVEVTSNFGCTAIDSITLFVDVDVEELLDPVNVITPNGDGVNDQFIVRGLEFFPNTKVTILNRWGGLIYQQDEYQNDWDGTYNEDPVPAGNYLYIITVSRPDREVTRKGTLTIIR